MAGRLGLPGGAAYGATKAALISLTQSWTAEFSPRGVRVNAVAPGPVYTRPEARDLFDKLGATTPLNRAAEPAEVAEVVGTIERDRKSTRLNSSHVRISYAVLCMEKKQDRSYLIVMLLYSSSK